MARILLLQSDDQLAQAIAGYLTLNGHQVAVHKDPQAAVSAADAQAPDIVITDLSLAGRSGAEFLYEIRSYPDWRGLPVIATGNLSFQQIEPFIDSLNQLEVSVYLPRQSSDLHKLLLEIDKLLAPART